MNIQLDLLKLELKLVHGQIDKFDRLGATIKGWAVMLWAASIGWSISTTNKSVILISILMLIIFWSLDSIYKTFRRDYAKRRGEIEQALNQIFETGTLPKGVVAPKTPEHHKADSLKNFFVIHNALPYILLILVSILLYFYSQNQIF